MPIPLPTPKRMAGEGSTSRSSRSPAMTAEIAEAAAAMTTGGMMTRITAGGPNTMAAITINAGETKAATMTAAITTTADTTTEITMIATTGARVAGLKTSQVSCLEEEAIWADSLAAIAAVLEISWAAADVVEASAISSAA